MGKLHISLFGRLYFSILLVLSFSIGLTYFLSHYWAQQDAKNDFIRDARISFSQLKNQAETHNLTAKDYLANSDISFHFNIHWQAKNSLICIDCQLLLNHREFKLYQLNDGNMLVQFFTPKSGGAIVIQDRVESLESQEDSDEIASYDDPEDWLPILIIISSLLAMALGLYYPIRQLHKKIKQLNNIQREFGNGQLDIRANVNLPSPFDELASHFNTMASNIEQTVIENQIFAQAVPHEIRTPLSRIQLAAGILANSQQTEENQALLNNIDTYIEDINSLIKQLLTLSKLNQNSGVNALKSTQLLAVESINLEHFIKERILVLIPSPRANLTYNIEPHYNIICEASYLRLILDNLITNAYRYCRHQMSISIERHENDFEISIEEDGKGIDEQDYEKIFLPFSRLDKSRTSATGGLGLGLAIAQAAARKLSANLSVSKSDLNGAKFTLTIKNS